MMLPYNRNNKGLSLVELLIATSIVGMIMVGMVSIDYSLRTSERQQSRASLVALRTAAMMDEIVNNASQAFGDVASRCIQIGSTDVTDSVETDNTNYICIYRDLNNTPADMTNDTWICYTRRSTDLFRCASATITHCAAGTLVGTLTSDSFDSPDSPVFVSSAAPLDHHFRITLKNRYDPTTADFATVVAQEYLTNPKIQITSRVSPAACVE